MKLAPRQAEVAAKLLEGKLNKQIAHEMGISMSTVKATLQRVYEKLGVRNRTQAAMKFTSEHPAPREIP